MCSNFIFYQRAQFFFKNFRNIPEASLLAVSRAGCTKHIAVRTSEACEPKAECIAQNEKMEMLELYPLIPQHGHEIVADVPETNGSIYMNLCGPMEPIRGKKLQHVCENFLNVR